jgi:hypothetical protein
MLSSIGPSAGYSVPDVEDGSVFIGSISNFFRPLSKMLSSLSSFE